MEKILTKIEKSFLSVLLFLFPFFFLPTTQDFFIFNKLYLIFFGVIILILISSFKVLITRKIFFSLRILDIPIIFFAVSSFATLLFTTPNIVQGALSPISGPVMFFSLSVLYMYISRVALHRRFTGILLVLVAIANIVLFFQPLKNTGLSSLTGFPGGQVENILFLGFLFVIEIGLFIKEKHKKILDYVPLIFGAISFAMIVYGLVKSKPILPPIDISWFAFLETMKSIKTALLGVGFDNFSSFFTRSKTSGYNLGSFWQIASFNTSSSLLLHIATEMGIVGIIAFLSIVFTAALRVFPKETDLTEKLVLVYLIAAIIFFPPSLTVFFLVYFIFGLIAVKFSNNQGRTIDLNRYMIATIGIFIITIAALGASLYLLGRTYLAEIRFKKAITALSANKTKDIYDNLKAARVLNPYSEKYILNFSQTNLLIADGLAREKGEKLSNKDRQTIAQAIQAAISEAKQLIKLNPQKAQHYAGLADVYRNIIPIASGADAWAISAYQRAIVLDPSNPQYRLNLGGIYYLLGKYAEAISFFTQAAQLKPNWPNAYYNLAWSHYQNKEYEKAAVSMNAILRLINQDSSPDDYQKVKTDLEVFKQRLETEKSEATSSGDLNLPEKSDVELDPKIKL